MFRPDSAAAWTRPRPRVLVPHDSNHGSTEDDLVRLRRGEQAPACFILMNGFPLDSRVYVILEYSE